ncbi:hypothetical protein [Chitinophaga sp. CF118]|uniref:hypothetical protein n=1 Tax=Chitinophaga sp. CF118 TaxID=1884367 RepID=UPI00116096E0|nr:hypothetical protein [Chitinophaga sp. CF118]
MSRVANRALWAMCSFALLLSMPSAFAQRGYVYVHLRALNEKSSHDFPFTLSGGIPGVDNFTLNYQQYR